MHDEKSIEGVILAAGTSFRAGTFKPALLIGGKPMIALCIKGMYDLCQRIIVVGGHDIERLRSLLDGFDKTICVENSFYREGMFTSVKAGLAIVRADRCFVLPGDVPLVPSGVFRQLLLIDADVVVPTFQGRNGHPICLSRAVIPRILREPDDSTLRDVIRMIGYDSADVGAEEILIDIDTPQDYEAVCRRLS
jgi:molybdenum cofactor cytidylyltransferase